MSGNPGLDGRSIPIPGYVIAVLDKETVASTSGSLVPERGMCSHMPAPDPNQMIRYTLAMDWAADSIYEPVELVGRLSIRPTRQEITLVDGQVEIKQAVPGWVRIANPVRDWLCVRGRVP